MVVDEDASEFDKMNEAPVPESEYLQVLNI